MLRRLYILHKYFTWSELETRSSYEPKTVLAEQFSYIHTP